jgi:hypothetical protein
VTWEEAAGRRATTTSARYADGWELRSSADVLGPLPFRAVVVVVAQVPGLPGENGLTERLGHADGGALLLRTYRHVRAGETRAALDLIGYGLRAAANG